MDYTVTLTARQDAAIQSIIDNFFFPSDAGTPKPTKAEWVTKTVLAPIREELRRQRLMEADKRQDAIERATPEVKAQIDALLGL